MHNVYCTMLRECRTCEYRRSQIKVSLKEMFDRSKTALIRFIEQCFIIGNFICHLFDVGSTGLGGSASNRQTFHLQCLV